MTQLSQTPIPFTLQEAEEICLQYYGLAAKAFPLTGELDLNFKMETANQACFILKINRPNTSAHYLDFQEKLLLHVKAKKPKIKIPSIIPTLLDQYAFTIQDAGNNDRNVRLLEWIPGRLWSTVNPKLDSLLFSLGEVCGEITSLLQDFEHPTATRVFDWDIAQANWTTQFLHLFSGEEKECIGFFMHRYHYIQPAYHQFRKSVIHNDANDNNIIVSDDLLNPLVETIIDFGDAAYSQTINDLAVAIAYATMDVENPLAAALPIVSGYHSKYPLEEKELEVLYVLVAIRLVISVTKSAINKNQEPDNVYLQISDKQAWSLLHKWKQIAPEFAHFSFRTACGFSASPNEREFTKWAATQKMTMQELFPSLTHTSIIQPDLSIGSLLLGNFSTYHDIDTFSYKINQLQKKHPKAVLAGGYLEARPVYSTNAFIIKGNNGPEYRTHHLGMDVWLPANTPIHAICDGEIFSFADNAIDKDYGPTIIIKHKIRNEFYFYTLYGHLSKESLVSLKKGTIIKKGDMVGSIGNNKENGNWPPHLHFQILLELLVHDTNFPGVCSPGQLPVWSSLCPNPGLIVKSNDLAKSEKDSNPNLMSERKMHLGKSLSLSYRQPLQILRGEMQYLIDEKGRRYLDTVNNVAHVGHEHPAVVKAGQEQMAVINTNTRYLHKNIIAYAEELCKTLPPTLSVIHFVNSGSEANELALRMAKAYTNQKDIIALEVGYHGNTGSCIDISSYKFDGKGGKGKPEHTHIVTLPDSFRGKYRGSLADTGELYASHIKETINEIKKTGRGVAAFIAESIVSCGGQIVLPDNYLQMAYAYVREAGGVCIADEVQVGFGRVGKKFWGFELQGVVPDIVTMGKPIGNGHPLAAVACTPEIAIAFANGMEYFNTFGGNPVSSAIGLEVLKIIKEDKLQENALAIGEYLKKGLTYLQTKFPIIGDIRGEGFFLGIEFVEPGKVPATDKTEYIANRMKEHGILMSVDGPQNNVLKIKPPMCFNKENADDLFLYLEKTMNENFISG